MRLYLSFFIIFFFSSCSVINLLNSGTMNIKYTVSTAKLNGVKYKEKERISKPSISIRNIQHPKKNGAWSINFKITPSLHIDNLTYRSSATFYNNTTERTENYRDINVRRFMGLGNLKMTTHTPIGAFALSAGFGGSIYTMNDGAGLDTTKTREVRRVDLAYYGFLSKRFFILMGPRYYDAGYESYVFAFRIGYFWDRI